MKRNAYELMMKGNEGGKEQKYDNDTDKKKKKRERKRGCTTNVRTSSGL